jgi:hypothetical protein
LFEYPGVKARVERALAALGPGPAPEMCEHLERGRFAFGAILCAQHVDEGLRCPRCADRHTRGHDQRAELACDSCDVIPPGGILKPICTVAPVSIVEVGRRRGRVLPVVIGSLGVCRRCRGLDDAA